VSEHGHIGFAESVGKSIGNYADRPIRLTGVRFGMHANLQESVGESVGDYGKMP
jgi:hypothetical protein